MNHLKIDNECKLQAENIYKDSFPKILTVARLDRRKITKIF